MSQFDVFEVLFGSPGVWFSVDDIVDITGLGCKGASVSAFNCWKWYCVDRGVGGVVKRMEIFREDYIYVFVYAFIPD